METDTLIWGLAGGGSGLSSGFDSLAKGLMTGAANGGEENLTAGLAFSAGFPPKDAAGIMGLNFLNKLTPYVRNKLRPFLFMVGEKDKLIKKTIVAIGKILLESHATSPPAPRTSEVSVSGETM